MAESSPESTERRHSPRFVCGGRAKVAALPLEGLILPGKLLDLSLGGCCVETAQPLQPGTPAEILVQVNDASFRALCLIKAIRDRLTGMQFVELTEAGNRILRDILADAAKYHAAVSALRGARRRQDDDLLLELQEEEPRMLNAEKKFPILRRIVTTQPVKEESVESPDKQESKIVSPVSNICVVSIDIIV